MDQAIDPWLILFINEVQNEPVHGPLPPHLVSFVWDVMFVFEAYLPSENLPSTSDAIANATRAILNLFSLAIERNIASRDLVLAYNQFLAIASMSEHYDSKDLADVTFLMAFSLPPLVSGLLKREILKNMLYFFGDGMSNPNKEEGEKQKEP